MTDTYRPFNSTIRVISENEYGKMRNDKCARKEPEQINWNFYSMGQQTRRDWEKGFLNSEKVLEKYPSWVLLKLENVHSAIASTIFRKTTFARFEKLTQRKRGSE